MQHQTGTVQTFVMCNDPKYDRQGNLQSFLGEQIIPFYVRISSAVIHAS
jgi:hypothetical protein